MSSTFSPRAASAPGRPPFDAEAVHETIRRALASAGLDTQSGPMKGVADTIRQALSRTGAAAGVAPASARGAVIDVVSRVIGKAMPGAGTELQARPPAPALPGEFLARSHAGAAGTRLYKLYVPANRPASGSPLVVMLHGCTQDPDDFAAGTRMNELAERHGFLVAYPAQTARDNGSKCWNWFRAEDQARDGGEPALIAGITREVAREWRVDERRIYVAGLSAGAAMAVILGRTWPELYAAVGVHSGLPHGAAHDVPSAFAAMRAGPGTPAARSPGSAQQVPTIVFHGDGDAVVSAANGDAVVRQALEGGPAGLRADVRQGTAPGGRGWRCTVHADGSGRPVVEHWLLHGAGHAWSGGSASGSHTDAAGPDASAEMVRFFLAQAPSGTA